MNVTIFPGRLSGAITPPPSKSQAHRLIIAAALAKGESRLDNLAQSQDIAATISCMRRLGAGITVDAAGQARISGAGPHAVDELPVLDCGESGSTLRFLIPVALAVTEGGLFLGHGRLMQRPQGPYETLFREKGVLWDQTEAQLRVQGRLTPGDYVLPGNVSSQFITGLMYALPLLEGDSRILLTTPLESRGYVDMTLEALSLFGISLQPIEGGWLVPGRQRYQAQQFAVEADYSQAAFFCAANGLGSHVTILGLDPASAQGDRVILEYTRKLSGAGTVTLDVSQCPDLVPALAVQAALRPGETTYLINAARLRIKESDRIDTVTTELNRLGARVEPFPDSMTIRGVSSLGGGETDSHNDHRIAMMLAVAATRAEGPVTIQDAGSVAKSYPNFWEDYEKLGGRLVRQED